VCCRHEQWAGAVGMTVIPTRLCRAAVACVARPLHANGDDFFIAIVVVVGSGGISFISAAVQVVGAVRLPSHPVISSLPGY